MQLFAGHVVGWLMNKKGTQKHHFSLKVEIKMHHCKNMPEGKDAF